jgi:5-deoxy-D-glucuronate isomerase
MATFFKFQDFSEQLIRGIHDFDAHTFKVYLTNAAPSASLDAVKADLAEIAAGNGYTAGGNTTTITVAEVTGTTTVSGTEVVFTATGAVGPFQYAVLYNDTSTSKNLVGAWDYGSSISLATGETFTVKFSNTNPGAILTLA